MRLRKTCVSGALALAGFFGLASRSAQAVDFNLDVFADGVFLGSADATRMGCVDNPDGVTAVCQASNLVYGGDYSAITIDELNLQLDSDPTVNGLTSMTNNQAFTQHFTLVFTLGVAPIGPSTLTGGSVRGTVRDNTGDGATVAAFAGNSIYTSLIDGSDYVPLYPDPSSFSAGALLTANIPSTSFGSPIPSLVGPAVASDIGIRLDFTLTGNDSAGFTSNFVVTPEPHSLAMVGLGLALLARRRR